MEYKANEFVTGPRLGGTIIENLPEIVAVPVDPNIQSVLPPPEGYPTTFEYIDPALNTIPTVTEYEPTTVNVAPTVVEYEPVSYDNSPLT